MYDIAAAVESARREAGLSQRALADRTGLSQPTLNRILTGQRTAKLPEVVRIADAVGCTIAQLTGTSVAGRVEFAARGSNGADMSGMRQRLLHFLELDAYLDDQAIPESR